MKSIPARIAVFLVIVGCSLASPPVHAQSCLNCPGDLNGDGLVRGDDMQLFTNCMLTGQATGPCACADMDRNGSLDQNDATILAAALVRSSILVPAVSVGKDLQEPIVLTIAPPPPNNIIVTVTSGSPTQLLLSTDPNTIGTASLAVPMNTGCTTMPPIFVQALDGTGTVTVTVSATGYAPAMGTVTLQPSGFIIDSPGNFTTATTSPNTPIHVRPARLDPGTLAFVDDQPLRGGMGSTSVSVTSSSPGIGTITISPLVFSGNMLDAVTQFDPIAAGATNITAGTPAGFSTPSNHRQITATVSNNTITMPNLTIGKDLQDSTTVTLGSAAPAGGLVVTLTSSDTNRALLSTTATGIGAAAITVTIAAGSSSSPAFYVQGTAAAGTALITATAPNYADGLATATLMPSGFVFLSGNFSTTSFSLNTTLDIRSARLSSTLAYSTFQALRGGIAPVSVGVFSSNTAVGTITVSPLTFNGGSALPVTATAFDPASAGASTLSLATPAGFDTPSNMQLITATVTAPDISMVNSETVGEDLQASDNVSLSQTPPAPVDITVLSNNTAIVTVSDTATAAGGALVTFANVANTAGHTVYIQGRAIGNTTLTIQANGFNTKTVNVQVDPSGFVFLSSSFSTTTFSSNTSLDIRSARLSPATLAYSTFQPLRGGLAPVNVGVTSSNTSVGTLTISPLTFNAGSFLPVTATAFDPTGAGTSNLNIVPPPGFDTPSTLQQITATVTAPGITIISNSVVGRDLQSAESVSLTQTPPAPVDIVITSNNTAIATVSDVGTAAGGAVVTFPNVANTSTRTVYVQGRAVGNTTLTVQAAGYDTRTVNVQVDPSGFVFLSGNFSTTTFSLNTTLDVRPARLLPATLAYSTFQPIRGGMSPVSVPVTSSNTTVGTITVSPLTFNANTFVPVTATAFDPAAAGSSNLGLVTPAGFDTPSNMQQVTATVTAPDISTINSVTVGRDLQSSENVSLSQTPPSPVDITILSNNPSVVTVSDVATTAGGAMVTFANVANTNSHPYYVQGLALGTTTLTIQATGFNTKTVNVQVDPSGFVFLTGNFSTNASSPNVALDVRPARLDPVTLNYSTYQAARGGMSPVSVDVTSSTGAGAITVSPVSFVGGSFLPAASTAFDPISAGTSTLSVVAPAGFSVPSNLRQITATVNP